MACRWCKSLIDALAFANPRRIFRLFWAILTPHIITLLFQRGLCYPTKRDTKIFSPRQSLVP